MDSDVGVVLIERILLDLKNALTRDPLIDEFDILPVHESTQNRSPVIHVNNKLALEDWCLKPLYVYTYNKFFDWKHKKLKVDTNTVLTWTCAILLINPEIETAWHARKELVGNLVEELKLTELVLIRRPKSSPVFAHRKWVLLKLNEKKLLCPELIKQELFVCSRVANLYGNNYYAWSHRSWIIQALLQTCLKTVSEELIQTESWVSKHISDHSGFHYRQFLLSCFCDSTQKCNPEENCSLHPTDERCFPPTSINEMIDTFTEALYKEIIFLSDLQTIYPGHETLWYHRRYLLHETCRLHSNEETRPTKMGSLEGTAQSKKHKSETDLVSIWDIISEENFLKHCFNQSVNQNWERSLISRHFKWLSNVLKWQLTLS